MPTYPGLEIDHETGLGSDILRIQALQKVPMHHSAAAGLAPFRSILLKRFVSCLLVASWMAAQNLIGHPCNLAKKVTAFS